MSNGLENTNYLAGKNQLHFSPKKGEAFDLCASLSYKYICCGVHVLKAVSNCPFECSYCFLQNYLTNTTTSVVEDVPALFDEVKTKIADQPWRFFRVGTWELGDSLALKAQRKSVRELILGFRGLKNAVLELKTKSDQIDHLLDLDHQGRTVISWSVNTEKVIAEEESKTARLKARLKAMKKVEEAGYLIGIHFDPVILYPGCETDYEDLANQIFKTIPGNRVACVSIGGLRFNPEMKKTIEQNYPKSRITAAEMVLGDDNKCRYPRPVRIPVYKRLYQAVRSRAGQDCLIYLCMERSNVWREVLGYVPSSIGHLDYLFTKSLHERFPGLVHKLADLSLYEAMERKQIKTVKR